MEFILSKLVSQHVKRMIFVSSLFTRISGLQNLAQLERSAIAKLNRVMAVTTDDAALSLPARMQGLVWNNTNLNEVLTDDVIRGISSEHQMRELSTVVVDMTPKCLRYGTKPGMIDDVFRLITEVLRPQSFAGNQPAFAAAA